MKTITRRALGLPAALLLSFGAAGAAPQDPFGPGQRWAVDADAGQPWIPTSLGFAAGEVAVWAGAGYGTPHLLLLSAVSELKIVEDASVQSTFPILEVAAGDGLGNLFALAQYPSRDPWNRRTEISANAMPSSAGAAPARRWTHDMGLIGNGAARIACDERGDLVAAALWDSAGGRVRLDLLASDDGRLLHRADFPATSLADLVVSADGTRVALATGLSLRIFDAAGTLLSHWTLAGGVGKVAVDADASTLAFGSGSDVLVLRETDSGHILAGTLRGGAGEVPVSLAVAGEDESIAVGWWESTAGVDLRVETFSAFLAPQMQFTRQGLTGGLQDLPAELLLDATGERLALGTWGNGSADPELLLLDARSGAVVLTADLPGSVTALAMDRAGARLAVGYKHTHANQVGSTGGVRLYDTGEREQALRTTPTVGGSIELSFRRTDALSAGFLIGFPAPSPVPVSGLGDLLIDRSNRFWIHSRPLDSSGRADLTIPVPNLPTLFGLELSSQVLWRRLDGQLFLSPEVVDFVLF